MVHDMVVARTGQVPVERGEGQGTTVTVTLLHTTDARRVHQQAEQVARRAEAVTQNYLKSVKGLSRQRCLGIAREQGSTPSARIPLTSLSFHCETFHAKTKISSNGAGSVA
jgi:hypothetical protein